MPKVKSRIGNKRNNNNMAFERIILFKVFLLPLNIDVNDKVRKKSKRKKLCPKKKTCDFGVLPLYSLFSNRLTF